jgi:hypothetical protein
MAFVRAADEKHQIIIGAQGFGKGQEQATLTPLSTVLKRILGTLFLMVILF